ncbi:MAG: 3-deoxy-manno-octulosonate cytidylyltransferase [Prolixibacteraceae bacterium]
MKFIAIIPARYASTRFPGKPLVEIHGLPMIQHVYQQSLKAFEQVVVATDDQRIADVVKSFGGNVVLTSSEHPSGTDRVAEAAKLLSEHFEFDVVVNVQGDEPFIDPEQLFQIKQCFDDPQTDIATLIVPITSTEVLFDSNKVKAVSNSNGFALYFSRLPIPFQRDYPEQEWLKHHTYFLHVGIYAYRTEVLDTISKLKQTPLEQSEMLEQLRWLENGYRIKTAHTAHGNIGIDTPNDLTKLPTQ